MNSLDQKLDLFSRSEPSAADVQDAQRKLEARILVDMDVDAIVANARQWRDRIAAVRTA